MVAREVQDLALSVDGIATAIRESAPNVTVNVPEAAPPTINVEGVVVNVPQGPAPVFNVPSAPVADVNVAAPVVNVAAADVSFKPVINLPPVKANAYEVQITERDDAGFISKFVINPI